MQLTLTEVAVLAGVITVATQSPVMAMKSLSAEKRRVYLVQLSSRHSERHKRWALSKNQKLLVSLVAEAIYIPFFCDWEFAGQNE